DYGIDSIYEQEGNTRIRLKRIGLIPMPIDLLLTFKDGSQELHYVPLDLMFGEKPAESDIKRKTYEAWKWTHPTYEITTTAKLQEIIKIEIDPSRRMADINPTNNILEVKW